MSSNNYEEIDDGPSQEESTSRGGRDRGRRSAVARGGRAPGSRGRGDSTTLPQESALKVERAERQLTQRRIAGSREREPQLHRVLLPDAPPSKKRARPSPLRDECEIVDSPYCFETVFVEVPSQQLLAPQQPQAPQQPHVILEDDFINVEEDEDQADYHHQQQQPGPNDPKDAETIDEWLRGIDSDLSDIEIDCDDETFRTITERNAADEPAADFDLTPLATHVLHHEDRLDDIALRKIVPADCLNFDWDSDKRTFTGQRETFTEMTGPTFSVTDHTKIVDVFYKMIDTDFVDLLCTETNRYAAQKIALAKAKGVFGPKTRLYRWSPTDRDEMISYLALTILMGLYPLPEEESYFSFNGFGTTPYFSRIMSYNRFHLLKTMLHFVDNASIIEKTKLWKIQPVTDYFNDKFSSLYYPSQEIAIDESLLKWSGRLGFAQKIKSKAARVGIKTYELCESASGYLWKFFVYVGKNKQTEIVTEDMTNDVTDDVTIDVTNDVTDYVIDDETTDNNVARDQDLSVCGSDYRPDNATAKIVYDLVEPLLHRGHTLIMDNFYNSPLLARSLKRQKTDCYGTLRLNRQFVPSSLKTLKKTDLRFGEVVAKYCSDLSVIAWRDSIIVSMISTYHHMQIGTQQKYDRVTYKPQVVLDYNKSMGGVDRKDQFLSAQPMERVRNKVWYKKLFRRLFNTAIYNCFVIYKSANNGLSHRKFRTLLAENLLTIHRQIDLKTEPRLIMTNKRLVTMEKGRNITATRRKIDHDHFPIKSGFNKSRCRLCSQRKVVSRTVWKCMECGVNLCIEGCFRDYHKLRL